MKSDGQPERESYAAGVGLPKVKIILVKQCAISSKKLVILLISLGFCFSLGSASASVFL
jgi:hypothetical protein